MPRFKSLKLYDRDREERMRVKTVLSPGSETQEHVLRHIGNPVLGLRSKTEYRSHTAGNSRYQYPSSPTVLGSSDSGLCWSASLRASDAGPRRLRTFRDRFFWRSRKSSTMRSFSPKKLKKEDRKVLRRLISLDDSDADSVYRSLIGLAKDLRTSTDEYVSCFIELNGLSYLANILTNSLVSGQAMITGRILECYRQFLRHKATMCTVFSDKLTIGVLLAIMKTGEPKFKFEALSILSVVVRVSKSIAVAILKVISDYAETKGCVYLLDIVNLTTTTPEVNREIWSLSEKVPARRLSLQLAAVRFIYSLVSSITDCWARQAMRCHLRYYKFPITENELVGKEIEPRVWLYVQAYLADEARDVAFMDNIISREPAENLVSKLTAKCSLPFQGPIKETWPLKILTLMRGMVESGNPTEEALKWQAMFSFVSLFSGYHCEEFARNILLKSTIAACTLDSNDDSQDTYIDVSESFKLGNEPLKHYHVPSVIETFDLVLKPKGTDYQEGCMFVKSLERIYLTKNGRFEFAEEQEPDIPLIEEEGYTISDHDREDLTVGDQDTIDQVVRNHEDVSAHQVDVSTDVPDQNVPSYDHAHTAPIETTVVDGKSSDPRFKENFSEKKLHPSAIEEKNDKMPIISGVASAASEAAKPPNRMVEYLVPPPPPLQSHEILTSRTYFSHEAGVRKVWNIPGSSLGKPPVPIDPVVWEIPVFRGNIENTIWNKVCNGSFDASTIPNLAEKIVKALGNKNAVKAGKDLKKKVEDENQLKVKLLSDKQSHRIVIVVKCLKLTPDEVVRSLVEMNAEALGLPLLKELSSFFSNNPVNLETLTHKYCLSDMKKVSFETIADELVYKASLLPYINLRLLAMVRIPELQENTSLAKSKLGMISEACDSIMKSEWFPKVINVILTIGNYANSMTYRANSISFKMSSLSFIMDKNIPNGKGLKFRDFFNELLANDLPELFSVKKELECLNLFSAFSIPDLISIVKELSETVSLMEAINGLQDKKDNTLAKDDMMLNFVERNEAIKEQAKEVINLLNKTRTISNNMCTFLGDCCPFSAINANVMIPISKFISKLKS